MRKFLAIGAVAVAVAMPLSTSAATSSTAKWQGHWRTSCWGNAMFFQNGRKVTGSASGTGANIVGTVSGLKLSGTWKVSRKKHGTFVWTLTSTHKKFTGHWTYNGTTKSCRGAFTGGF